MPGSNAAKTTTAAETSEVAKDVHMENGPKSPQGVKRQRDDESDEDDASMEEDDDAMEESDDE